MTTANNTAELTSSALEKVFPASYCRTESKWIGWVKPYRPGFIANHYSHLTRRYATGHLYSITNQVYLMEICYSLNSEHMAILDGIGIFSPYDAGGCLCRL